MRWRPSTCSGLASSVEVNDTFSSTTKAALGFASVAAGATAAALPRAAAVRARMAAHLGLRDGGADWHTQRDEWVALGCELGLLAGSLGKIGTDIALLNQHEVAEVMEPEERGRGVTSVMPHKRNPVASMLALAAAQRVPGPDRPRRRPLARGGDRVAGLGVQRPEEPVEQVPVHLRVVVVRIDPGGDHRGVQRSGGGRWGNRAEQDDDGDQRAHHFPMHRHRQAKSLGDGAF